MSSKCDSDKVFLTASFSYPGNDKKFKKIEIIGVPGKKSANDHDVVEEEIKKLFNNLIIKTILKKSNSLHDCNFDSLKIWLYDMKESNENYGYQIPEIKESYFVMYSSLKISNLERIYVFDNELTGREQEEWKKTAKYLFTPLFNNFVTPPELPEELRNNPVSKFIERGVEIFTPSIKIKQTISFNALIIKAGILSNEDNQKDVPNNESSVEDFVKGTDEDKPSSNISSHSIYTKKSQYSNNYQEPMIDLSRYLREPKYTLKDIILPKKTINQIESILAELEHQDLIYKKWGMGEKHKLDKALSVNFAGLPGTGKTMTAEGLAEALKMKILDVPYQLLESKFVGETPKNIAKAFEFATENKALLFFDEADSFLGKRLENVTQSTDTAVNLTRSVMLKQLSEYEGVVVFATNLITNYDLAFISRIRWKVQFDLPDEEAREKVWKIQFPDKLPRDESVNVLELAKYFDNVSGRDIKNAVFQGVVSAAREDKCENEKKVTQSHLIDAISQIIAANKAAAKPEIKLERIEKEVS